MHEAEPPDALNALRNNDVDVALIFWHGDPPQHDHRDATITPLLDEPLYVVTPATAPGTAHRRSRESDTGVPVGEEGESGQQAHAESGRYERLYDDAFVGLEPDDRLEPSPPAGRDEMFAAAFAPGDPARAGVGGPSARR